MPAGNGEVPAPVVCLEASLAVSPLRQCGSHEDMNACPGRADLRVGVELLDDRPGPRLYFLCQWIEATIEVYAAEVVLRSEHDAYPSVALFPTGSYSLLVACPGVRVRAAGPPTRYGGIRDLRRLAFALLRAPAHPLPQVPDVLRLCRRHLLRLL